MKIINKKDKQDILLATLVKHKAITNEQLEQVQKLARMTKESLENILESKNFIDPEEIAKAKAEIYEYSYANLMEKKISESVLNTIIKEVAENYKIICFEKDLKNVKIGIVDPDNFKAIEAIDFLAKEQALHVSYFLISPQSFEKGLKQYTTLGKEISSALLSKEQEEAQQQAKSKREGTEIEEVIKSAPVVKIVSVIIRHAVEGRASDIHIEPMHKDTRVRYRIDGVLHTSLVLPKSVHTSIVARIKVMANLKLDETRIPQDGRFDMNISDRDIDFRVSIIPLMNDEKVVMRILDISKSAPTLDDLGFGHIILRTVMKSIKNTNGMFLVTGPTGSGKSTTLFSILNIINKEGINISTLEDPVEYYVKGVNQSQIRTEVGYTFATGLRSLLRQDPDIIMVGEIRDNETAELAIHASLTGHFVLSTLHTNNAIGAVARLIDMKVEPFLLSSTLKAILAQRLARKICANCKQEFEVPPDIFKEIKDKISKIPLQVMNETIPNFDISKMKFYHGKGCPRCGNTGYNGRVSICEVIDVNEDLRKLIAIKMQSIENSDLLTTQDFVSMEQDGLVKAVNGVTTVEEVMRVIRN